MELSIRDKANEGLQREADWEISTVGKEFDIQLGKMLDKDKNTGTPKPYIGNKAVQWGRINIDEISTMLMTDSDLSQYRLRKGDLLVCEGGEVGRAAIWDAPIDECYYQKALHRLRPIRGYEPRLLLAFLEFWTSRDELSNYVSQTSIAHLTKEKFARVPLPVPSEEERRAILTALSDVDDLIAALDTLIAKKRAIKTATMQQLLTGKQRLPGFSGEWEVRYKQTEVGEIPEDWVVKAAGDICLKIQDGTHFSPTLGGNDFLYVTSKNIGRGVLDASDAERISASEHAKIYARCDVQQGDLLLTKDGANTGNAAINHLDEEFSLLSSVAFLRFDARVDDPTYYLHSILSDVGRKQIAAMMSGNAITRLTLEKIRQLRFPVPSLHEQRAIAAVLSDMDAEIKALEARRDKTRQIKQGMMQELLTGKTRLVGAPSAEASPA